MKLVNVGEKIINIGTTVLMPGESMIANESICGLPAIKAFTAAGLLAVDDSDTAFQKAVEEAARKMVEERPRQRPKPLKTRSRKRRPIRLPRTRPRRRKQRPLPLGHVQERRPRPKLRTRPRTSPPRASKG